MSNIRVISNNTQFKGMVEMLGDANLPDFASRKSKNPNEIKVKEAEKAK